MANKIKIIKYCKLYKKLLTFAITFVSINEYV